MKKLLLLLTFVCLLGCSSSDDNKTENSSSTSINPPSWLIGTWANNYAGDTSSPIYKPLFRFKNNDFCVLSSSMEICQAENIKNASQAGAKTSVKETATDKEYELSMTIQSLTTTYKFIKISNTKIEYVNTSNGLPNTVLIKQ